MVKQHNETSQNCLISLWACSTDHNTQCTLDYWTTFTNQVSEYTTLPYSTVSYWETVAYSSLQVQLPDISLSTVYNMLVN